MGIYEQKFISRVVLNTDQLKTLYIIATTVRGMANLELIEKNKQNGWFKTTGISFSSVVEMDA